MRVITQIIRDQATEQRKFMGFINIKDNLKTARNMEMDKFNTKKAKLKVSMEDSKMISDMVKESKSMITVNNIL